jgi:SAM-dependent methyltransferase
MTDTTTPNTEWIRRWATDEGQHWVAETERYDNINSGFGAAMLDAAALRAGERVLDIGCGNGATTIEAARRVRPGGTVVGVDVSPPMLARARARATAAAVDEIEFIEVDAQVYDFGDGHFDAAISRNGVMFFDDPNAAFANLARALRPGGRLAFTAPQGFDRNPWIMVAGAAAAPHVGMPPGLAPNAPGPLGLVDPKRTRDILDEAGFTEVRIEELSGPIRIGDDVDDAVAFLRSMPIVRNLLAAASPEKRAAAVDAVREAISPYAGPGGVVIEGNGAWLVMAGR